MYFHKYVTADDRRTGWPGSRLHANSRIIMAKTTYMWWSQQWIPDSYSEYSSVKLSVLQNRGFHDGACAREGRMDWSHYKLNNSFITTVPLPSDYYKEQWTAVLLLLCVSRPTLFTVYIPSTTFSKHGLPSSLIHIVLLGDTVYYTRCYKNKGVTVCWAGYTFSDFTDNSEQKIENTFYSEFLAAAAIL